MYVRGGHVHLRALVGRGSGRKTALIRGYLCSQAILGQLSGIGAFGTEELVDVLSKDVRAGQQGVISRIVFRCCLDDSVRILQLTLDGLNLLQGLSGLLSLGQERVLDDAGVAIQ